MKKKGILGLIHIIFPLIFTGCQKEPEEPAVFTNTIKNAQPENAGDDIKPVNKFSYGIHSKDLFDADNISDAESEYKNIQFYSTETDADGKFPTVEKREGALRHNG